MHGRPRSDSFEGDNVSKEFFPFNPLFGKLFLVLMHHCATCAFSSAHDSKICT